MSEASAESAIVLLSLLVIAANFELFVRLGCPKWAVFAALLFVGVSVAWVVLW